jgi:hypothetical protein
METKFVYLYIGILTLVVTCLSYWYLYLENNNYIFFQNIFALAMLGIFIALFTAWIMMKYNFYIGILIYVTYIVIWIWYAFDSLITLSFKNNNIIWDKFPWNQFGFAILILAIVFIPIFFFVFLRHGVSGSKLDMKHIAIALFMVFLVFTPNMMFAIDASIPYESKADLDPARKTFGAFGHSFPSEYWQAGMDWLSEQDNEFVVEERPAFISWWDYGFWCLYLGEHPTVADNFQAGYQLAGSFIASTNETQAISLFAVRIIEGDHRAKPRKEFSPEVRDLIINYYDDNSTSHPVFNRIEYLYNIETASKDKQNALIKEVDENPNKYGKLTDIKIRNAKYAAVRQILESKGKEYVVNFLTELNRITGNTIRYFAVDTRLFPFHAQNTGIFYAPIRLADRDIADYIAYYAIVDVRDNTQAEWRSYSDKPIPTEDIPDEIDLNDIVETHGQQNVRIKKYLITYTDDFYNSMFYKCYIGYTYEDIYNTEQINKQEEGNLGVYGAEVPGIYGELRSQQPLQGWNMTHFRLVYRTAYWTPYNQTELQELPQSEREGSWEAMSELEAITRIQRLEGDGVDNDNNGEIDDRGEGGTWSPSYSGGGVFFLKYYHGAIIRGKVVTETTANVPVSGVRVTVFDEFGIPHQSVFTNEEGNYNLTAPFGTVVVLASKDGYALGGDDELSQRLRLTEKTTLNSTLHEISDSQAMRRTSNYIINSDIKVPVGTTKGKLYWELTNNEEFNVGEDEIITDAKLFLNSTNKKYNLTYSIDTFDEDGNFEITDIVPGEYGFFAEINGHTIGHVQTININSDQLSVDMDFPIKPAVIVGNATFTNNTNFKPGNIIVSLKDLTNDTIINTSLVEGSKYYSFSDLLPGEYQVSVNQSGLQHFESEVYVEQDDNQSVHIDLIPIISVSGKVRYNPALALPEAGNIAPLAHVEFFNNDNSNFSTVLLADESGEFNGIITKGNFSVYIHYVDDGKDFVSISSLNVIENEPLNLELFIEPGFWINGRLTKQENTSVSQTKVQFLIQSDEANDTSLFVPTNNEGKYRICLPYREYRIEVYHISTPGNITYTYYNSSSYLQKDINEIIQTRNKIDNDYTNPARAKANGNSGSREITHNIHLDLPSNVLGHVYWDRNLDGKFFLDEESLADSANNSRARQNETSSVSGDIFGYSFEHELAGPEKELVIGARLAFTHDNGTLYAYTNETGYYEVYLPPFQSSIALDDIRFQPLDVSNPENATYIMIPSGKTHQPIGIPRNFSVVPANTTISGYTWFDSNGNGVFDINEKVTNVPINVIPISPIGTEGEEVIELVSDPETGAFEFDIIPGEYNLDIDFDPNPVVRYSHSSKLTVPFKHEDEPLHMNIVLDKYVFINLSITTDDITLNQSNLENVSITLYEEPDNTLITSPFELNGSYYTGFIYPGNYTIWADYKLPSELGEEGLEEIKYLYFGSLIFSETNNRMDLVLRNTTNLIVTAFVDEDGDGDFDTGEERPKEVNVTIVESTGAVLNLKLVNNTLNQTLMPGTSYEIHINDTRRQPAVTHGIKTVRYIHNSSFKLNPGNENLELDLDLIKYYNLSGEVYYDENVNNRPDNHELNDNVTIYFTGRMQFTMISNESGWYHKFVLPGEYFVSIEHEGFLDSPKDISYNVSLENTSFDIAEIPKKVRVHGFTYWDVNDDGIYAPDEVHRFGEEDLRDSKLGGTWVEFTKNILVEPDPATGELPHTEPLEDRGIRVKSNLKTGDYEIYLDPGEYNVYIYQKSDKVYANLDLRLIELAPSQSYNISLYEGRLVEGNVFYRDTNLNVINDLYSEETGNALRWESLDYAGSKLVQYGRISKGIYDSLYLSYGNYSVSTEYFTEEFELNMEYQLQDTVFVNPETEWYTFELNKKNDYTFDLTVQGEHEKMFQTGDYHREAFTILAENEGNVFNVIDFQTADVPAGWIVTLSNKTIPLDITGTHAKEKLTVDITIPTESLASNKIQITGIPRGDNTGKSKSVTITANTPAIYGFEVEHEEDLDRGIKFNDTLLLNLSVKNNGNADDELLFKFSNVPPTWNVSIGEAWRENADVKYDGDTNTFIHTISQTDVYKNLTIQIMSPTLENGSYNEEITFLVGAWSQNKRDIEYTEEISATIRNPDIIITNLKVSNADLKAGNNITIQAKVKNDYCYADYVNFSLFINNILIENKTVDKLNEDSLSTVTFSWNPEAGNVSGLEKKGRTLRFRVEVNSDRFIQETDYENNVASVNKFIGKEPVEEEFNWRPLIAMTSLLIIFLGIYLIYRWRKKI